MEEHARLTEGVSRPDSSDVCPDEPVRLLQWHSVRHSTACYVRMRGVRLRAMLAE
ncbi:hypothetical protein SAMN05442782_0562 [Streptomyces sp. OK228]|nr:hypothetical protein OK006_10679 [Actinobacteria bacterium OK006]SOE20595.1 hypothetical protein SAMN05442782_0562 [Streptomyces sp. OK228]